MGLGMKILEYIATTTAAATFGGAVLAQVQVNITPVLQLMDSLMV